MNNLPFPLFSLKTALIIVITEPVADCGDPPAAGVQMTRFITKIIRSCV